MILQINVQAKMGVAENIYLSLLAAVRRACYRFRFGNGEQARHAFKKYLAAKTGTYLHRKHRSDNHAFAIICEEKKSFH